MQAARELKSTIVTPLRQNTDMVYTAFTNFHHENTSEEPQAPQVSEVVSVDQKT